MKFFFDLFPVVLFFVTFKFKGIFWATGAAILASLAQIIWLYYRKQKIEPMIWISLAIITFFGGATLILHNETYIKWKPTILYWIFASVIFSSETFFKKNLIKAMLAKAELKLSEKIWSGLNLSWTLFFALLGGVNLYIASHFSTNVWVNFKLFGIMGILFAFVLIQGAVLAALSEKETLR